MTFEKISNGHDCDCLSKTSIPETEDIFLRKLRKQELADKDFETHWERGIGIDKTECEEICNYKGISINQTSDEIENIIFEHYKTTFNINPKKGAHCLKFKIKEGAGRIVYAPIISGDSHHNFFKSDLFDLSYIEPVTILKFA
jgi:hypothetical protein